MDAAEASLHRLSNGPRKQALTHTWHILDEKMPTGKQGRNGKLHRVLVCDQNPTHIVHQRTPKLAGACKRLLERIGLDLGSHGAAVQLTAFTYIGHGQPIVAVVTTGRNPAEPMRVEDVALPRLDH